MIKDLKKRNKKMKTFSFIATDEIHEKLLKLKTKGYKLTDVILDALKEYFKNNSL